MPCLGFLGAFAGELFRIPSFAAKEILNAIFDAHVVFRKVNIFFSLVLSQPSFEVIWMSPLGQYAKV